MKIFARVLEAGAFGYLKKPFHDGALVRCLEKALKTLKTRAPCEVAALDEVTGAAGPQVKGGRVNAEISVSSRGARKKCPLMMLWTAPPPAREWRGYGFS